MSGVLAKRWMARANGRVSAERLWNRFSALGVVLSHWRQRRDAARVSFALMPLESRVMLSADFGLDDPLQAPDDDPTAAIVATPTARST